MCWTGGRKKPVVQKLSTAGPTSGWRITMGLLAELVGALGLVAEGCPLHSPTAGARGSGVASALGPELPPHWASPGAGTALPATPFPPVFLSSCYAQAKPKKSMQKHGVASARVRHSSGRGWSELPSLCLCWKDFINIWKKEKRRRKYEFDTLKNFELYRTRLQNVLIKKHKKYFIKCKVML